MKSHILLFFAIIFLVATNKAKAQDVNQVSIFQDGIEHAIETEGLQQLPLAKKSFSIRFYGKKYNPVTQNFYPTQIAAPTDLDQLRYFKVGTKFSEIECLSSGTGIATYSDGYKSLHVQNYGHHYLFYENESSKRINIIDQEGEWFKFEFRIHSIERNDRKIILTSGEVNEIYLAILTDRNQNEVIDDQELRVVLLTLE